MEIIIVIAIVLVTAVIFFNRKTGADVNNDGKVDIADAKAAIDNTVVGVKEAVAEVKETVSIKADVNNDGKVDLADASTAVKKVATKAKRAAGQAKKAVTKPQATKTKKV